ncbi:MULTISPECIES: hypothetical protein [unclassified Microbacterium]|uniref:hypothetical protein n=1 Tax=unclassified Microbacterium TaxID=2609290 RepID=UPI00109C8677|nr:MULTISPECIES: hypothetical protein [unclassified Microbacterium]
MLEPEESEELRSLQARAYGRDSSLTAAEAERLRELEDRRLAPAAGAGPDAEHAVSDQRKSDEAPADDDADVSVGEGEAEDAAVAASADAASDDAVDATASASSSWRSLFSLLRTRWRPVALAAVVVLAIGVGVGWLAFGRSGAAAVELTAEQQTWQNELVAAGVYDPGSIRALGVQEDVVIWTATKDAKERTCLILGTGEATVPSCDRTEVLAETGIYGSISVKGDGALQREVSAQLLFTASGEPAVAVSAYDFDPTDSGITYANEAESETAARLAENGFQAGSLWVVGYDGDVPIWTAVQIESQNQCLIYDGSTDEAPVACADPQTMQEQASSLVLNVVDAETGGVTNFEMRSNQGPGYLVITREGGTSGAGGD